MDRDSINKARSVYYGLFASLFAFSMDEDNYTNITSAIEILNQSPIDEQTATALSKMQEILPTLRFDGLKNESDLVFYSPTTSLVPMTSSYYAEQRDDGKKRVEMMNYVLQSKFRRNSSEYKENEDHIEFICLFMQQLIQDELKGETHSNCLGKNIFKDILNPMLDPLSEKLLAHEHSVLYKESAIVLQSFTEIERLFHGVDKPVVIDESSLAKPNIKLQKEKKAPKQMVDRNHDEFVSV